jgi:hypothetical protein
MYQEQYQNREEAHKRELAIKNKKVGNTLSG